MQWIPNLRWEVPSLTPGGLTEHTARARTISVLYFIPSMSPFPDLTERKTREVGIGVPPAILKYPPLRQLQKCIRQRGCQPSWLAWD